MEKITVLHSADLHIDSPLHGLVNYEGSPFDAVKTATRTAFRSLVSTAIDRKADILLIAGDLYDGDWKDYNTGLFVINQLAELNDNNIKVVIIQGNHDAESRLTKKLRFPPNTKLLDSREPDSCVFDDLGVVVRGQSYPERSVTDNMAAGYPKGDPGLINIGLLHTCFDGTLGHAQYAPCNLDTLKSKRYDYWALGHVHKRKIIDNDPYIVFPGNLQGRHIIETGPKGAFLVTFEDKEPSLEELTIADVQWEHCFIDISGIKSFDDCLLRCEQELTAVCADSHITYALRIEFTGSTPLAGMLREKITDLTNEVRSISLNHRSQIWIEKVEVSAHSDSASPVLINKDLLRELDGIAAELRNNLGTILSENENLSHLNTLRSQVHAIGKEELDTFFDEEHLLQMTDDALEMLSYIFNMQSQNHEN